MLALAIAPTQLQSMNPVDTEAVETRWVTALQKADTNALDAILAGDYTDSDEDGGRTNKAGGPRRAEERDLKIQSITLGPLTVHVYGDTTVAIGSADQKGTFKGQPIASHIFFTDTCVKQGGQWRAVASHRTVPAAAAKESEEG